jgi:hypothetical protein
MLINVGLPIDDAEAEVDRIRSQMFAEMVQLLEATGDEAAVRKMAGLAPAETPPTPPVPPGPPGPTPPAPTPPAPAAQ